jgi:hypothetical protein
MRYGDRAGKSGLVNTIPDFDNLALVTLQSLNQCSRQHAKSCQKLSIVAPQLNHQTTAHLGGLQ